MKAAAVISFVVIAGLIAGLAIIGRPDNWPSLEDPPRQGEALDARTLHQARFIHSAEAVGRLIREPQNTWSNLAFVFAGSLLAGRAASRITRLVGVALVAVGIGSFLYHASASRGLRNLDVGAMNGLFFTTTLFVGTRYSGRLRARVDSHIWMVAVAALGFAVFATIARNFILFGVKPLALTTITAGAATVLIGALIFEAWRCRSIRVGIRVGIAIALFAAAVVCQIGDRPGGWFLNPVAMFQAHALWHVLSAFALLAAVRILDVPERPNQAFDRECRCSWGG